MVGMVVFYLLLFFELQQSPQLLLIDGFPSAVPYLWQCHMLYSATQEILQLLDIFMG